MGYLCYVARVELAFYGFYISCLCNMSEFVTCCLKFVFFVKFSGHDVNQGVLGPGGTFVGTDILDGAYGSVTKFGDYVLENDWFSLHNGGLVSIIIWLSSFLSAIVGASFWDSMEWIKYKIPGKIHFYYV
jgi:hypothetical protein